MIYMFIKDTDNSKHVVIGNCNITFCEIKKLVNFTYQWRTFPYYNASYNTNLINFCPKYLRCGYDDRFPESTFGGWLCGRSGCCINGICNLQRYPLIIGMISIVVMLSSAITILCVFVIICYGKKIEYEQL